MNSRQRRKLELARLANERLDEALRVQREAGWQMMQIEKRMGELKDCQEVHQALESRSQYMQTEMHRQWRELQRLSAAYEKTIKRLRMIEKENRRAISIVIVAMAVGIVLLVLERMC